MDLPTFFRGVKWYALYVAIGSALDTSITAYIFSYHSDLAKLEMNPVAHQWYGTGIYWFYAPIFLGIREFGFYLLLGLPIIVLWYWAYESGTKKSLLGAGRIFCVAVVGAGPVLGFSSWLPYLIHL